MPHRNPPPNRLTLAEVADLVGVHAKTAQRWALRGVRGKQLRSRLVGGRRYFCQADLADFLGESVPQAWLIPISPQPRKNSGPNSPSASCGGAK
jgi:hypothetical protein